MRKWFLALLVLTSLLTMSPRASAASCVAPEYQWPTLDVVVRARLLAIPEPGTARLEVSRYYKGSGPRLLEASIPGLGSGHRMDWQEVPRIGDELIIGFRQMDDGRLHNDLCTFFLNGWQESSWGSYLTGLLGPGQPPTDAAAPASPVIALLLPGLGLLALVAVLVRFRQLLTRTCLWAGGLLLLDQLTKLLAAAALGAGGRLLLAPGFGLTYVLNPGLWVNQGLAPVYIAWVQVGAFLTIAVLALYTAHYHEHYRPSPWLDLAMAFLLAALGGNMLLDRVFAHGARDFLVTPIAVANLADLYTSGALIALALEPVTFPAARRLLLSPRAWAEDLRRFAAFVRRG